MERWEQTWEYEIISFIVRIVTLTMKASNSVRCKLRCFKIMHRNSETRRVGERPMWISTKKKKKKINNVLIKSLILTTWKERTEIIEKFSINAQTPLNNINEQQSPTNSLQITRIMKSSVAYLRHGMEIWNCNEIS